MGNRLLGRSETLPEMPGDIPTLRQQLKAASESITNLDLISAQFKHQVIRSFIVQKSAEFRDFIREIVNILAVFANKVAPSAQEKQAANVYLRMITLLLPVLYERGHETFTRECLWEGLESGGGFLREETKGEQQAVPTRTAAIQLMNTLIRLAFLPNYTIHSSTFTKTQKTLHIGNIAINGAYMWAGFGDTSQNINNNDFELKYNRVQVLSCFVSLLSKDLYSSQADRGGMESNPYTYFLLCPSNELIYELIYSLMTSTLDINNWWTGRLGFLRPVGPGINEEHALKCSQLLGLFVQAKINEHSLVKVFGSEHIPLEFKVICEYFASQADKESNFPHNGSYYDKARVLFANTATFALANISHEQTNKAVLNSFVEILRNHYDVDNALLPIGKKRVTILEESLIILWRLFQSNSGFLNYLEKDMDSYEIMVHVLTSLMAAEFPKSNVSGIFHLCLLIFSMMSTDRNFALVLNKTFYNRLGISNFPLNVVTNGDLFIQVLANGIISTHEEKRNCYRYNLLAMLANLSPFLQKISRATTIKLLQMLSYFSSSKFIFDNQYNVFSLTKLLLFIENILQFQYTHNMEFIFECLTRQEIFMRLKEANIVKKTADPNHLAQSERGHEESKGNTNRLSNAAENNSSRAEFSISNEPKTDLVTPAQQPLQPQQNQQQQPKQASSPPPAPEETKRSVKTTIPPTKKPGEWRPTPEWFLNVKSQLPLDSVCYMIQILRGKILTKFKTSNKMYLLTGNTDDLFEEIKPIIEETSFVGLTKPKYDLAIETISDFEYIDMVLHGYLWKLILEKNPLLLHKFDTTKLVLIPPTTSPVQSP